MQVARVGPVFFVTHDRLGSLSVQVWALMSTAAFRQYPHSNLGVYPSRDEYWDGHESGVPDAYAA